MKKLLIIAAIAFIPYTLSAVSPYESQSQRSSSNQTVQTADCSHLSKKEQAFAANLNAQNRSMYCQKMTPEQRATAMTYMQEGKRYGKSMTPDAAVEKVINENKQMQQHGYDNSPCSRYGQ
ncbi:MAG: hypothetical protein MRY21_00180 [Simkaniaceae bacterium]|nr:hypothetical protein [Simkaniaceae bacterium]